MLVETCPMKMVLLRVGIDSSSGGMHGPLLKDGSFEYIPIPDRLKLDCQSNRYIYDTKGHGIDERKYGNTHGRYRTLLVEYFSAGRQGKMAPQSIHWDPEFRTFTYGDPSRPHAGLAKLCAGDMLVFYCGLQGWDFESPPALYLLGYFEVSRVVRAAQFSRDELLEDFADNYHVRHELVFEQQKPALILIKGGPGSRLFTKARKVSCEGKDCRGAPLKTLSPDMRDIFGDLGGRNSLQRSTPRWVNPEVVPPAAEYLRHLE